jgi:uncharacterized protein (DUF2249 family)
MSVDTASSRPALSAVARPASRESAPARTNDEVIAAIREHHAQLAEQETALTGAVISGDVGRAARDRLVDWYRTVLIPHTEAEERALYALAAELGATRLLVAGMLAEHRMLVSLLDGVADATGDLDAAAAASAIHAVFSVHLSKENDLLLPALDVAGSDLAAALDGMHEILGHGTDPSPPGDDDGCACGCTCDDGQSTNGVLQIGAAPSGRAAERDGDLDVRLLPHGARHDIIFARLDELRSGQALVIVNDHDPKPLRFQTEALWPGRFVWSYLESGPQVWRVAIRHGI